MATIREVNRLAEEKQEALRAKYAPSWTSPYGADPASYGLSPVTVVKYDGRRFRVCPPTRPGGLWTWGEVGSADQYAASSCRLALLLIGALCGIERRGGSFHYTREG